MFRLFAVILLIPAVFAFDQKAIRQAGANVTESRALLYAEELLDGIGPRLTGSSNLDQATEWARKKLVDIGCSNVRLESWGEFGLGWEERNVWVRMTAPQSSPLIGRAAPWSPGTRGAIAGALVKVPGFRNQSEFDAYRGKLKGKIVLLGTAPSRPEVTPNLKPLFERLTLEQLREFSAAPYEKPAGYGSLGEQAASRFGLMERIGRFLAVEGALAVLVPSGNNELGGASGGTIHVDTNYTFGWYVYRPTGAMRTPLVVLSVEHYGRLERLLARGVPVSLEMRVDVKFRDGVQQGSNLFAEIAGTHPRQKNEIVMVTAHLDSWAAGTGATDDGAGVIIAMEAMRILQRAGVRPNRTIRLALWTGEEQGSLGSRDYVKRHVATIPLSKEQEQAGVPEFMRMATGAVVPKEEHPLLSAVYTLDAGSGRIRGISTGDPQLVPLFQKWLAPMTDLGVTMTAPRSDCGGDCWTFEQVGIPTPSFKQDPLTYDSKTHHTNMDTLEYLVPEDLRQAATVVALVLYETAMAAEKLPRRTLP